MKVKPAAQAGWVDVDLLGLRSTLTRKGKAFAIFELMQNSFDENAEVEVTLTQPNKSGKSVLTCTDNAPKGYMNLSHAHTMFAPSYKKEDATKRGRFNVGEKLVLALCDEASITSTSGQILFNKDRTRTTTAIKRKAGTEFKGTLDLTHEEYDEVCKQVRFVLPPVKTTFNGNVIPNRTPVLTFDSKLATEVADKNGVTRLRQRNTKVRLYTVEKGEKPTLYERGLPVVEIDAKWHVDIDQKIPLSIERDNVTPAYEKSIYVAVLNASHDMIDEQDAASPWVRTAISDERVKDEAVVKVMDKRFGKDRVSFDPSDIGSNREAASKSHTVVTGGSMSKDEWKIVRRAKALFPAGSKFPTNVSAPSGTEISPAKYTGQQARFVQLIKDLSPKLIRHKVSVRIIDDNDAQLLGCTQWAKDAYVFTINLAHQNINSWHKNYELLIHEIAHHAVQSNDHLCREFYDTCTELGAKLAKLALDSPELFEGAA
jgi:hypothetical protein